MKYVWKGPPTAVEVFPAQTEGDTPHVPLFSGAVTTDREIEADLPEEHPQIVSWLAFGLISKAAKSPVPVLPARAGKTNIEEAVNG